MTRRLRLAAGKSMRYQSPTISDLDPDALYLFSSAGTEQRSRIPLWDQCLATRATQCVEVVETTATHLAARAHDGEIHVPLLDETELGALFRGFHSAYLDISGLPHHVWAPLVRVGLRVADVFRALYMEPASYARHPSPTSQSQFDLSDGFGGVSPISGFARLRGPTDEGK